MPNKEQYLELINSHNEFSIDELIIQKDTEITDLDYGTLEMLFDFRIWSEVMMLITSAYRKGDPRAHGEGKAFDIVLFRKWLEETISPKQLWLLATTYPWMGVGIYFDWHYVNKDGEQVPCVGIHVDNSHNGYRPLRWLRITKDVDGQPTKLYYYQNTTNGLFYNSKLKEVMRLDDAISRVRTK